MIKCLPRPSKIIPPEEFRASPAAQILEIGPYPPPYNGWSTRIFVVKNELERTGHTCVSLNLGENRRVISEDYECVRNGWEYLRKLMKYARRGYRFHVHSNAESLKGFLVVFLAYCATLVFLRRPFLSFHAGADQRYFPRHRSRMSVPFLKFLFGAAKGVVCDDPEVARHIAGYGISSQKIFPINPFTRQYLYSSVEMLDDNMECFFQTHMPVILTYVEIRPEYALQSVFQAIGRLALSHSNLGLIVTGATKEKQTIKELARNAGIEHRCLHIGAVDHALFLSILRRASVYLRSAKTEGISASIREALCFGIPVVANAVDIHPPGVFTYPWGNAEEIVKTVESALSESFEEHRSTNPSGLSDVPDTVPQEVDVLVCGVLKESRI